MNTGQLPAVDSCGVAELMQQRLNADAVVLLNWIDASTAQAVGATPRLPGLPCLPLASELPDKLHAHELAADASRLPTLCTIGCQSRLNAWCWPSFRCRAATAQPRARAVCWQPGSRRWRGRATSPWLYRWSNAH
jgi:hypothetical protein